MNFKVDYFDNNINFEKEFINVLEIENKKYFYRLVNDLYSIFYNGYADDITFFDENGKEKSMNGKLKVFIDFFNFEFDSKKYINEISKFVNDTVLEDDKNNLVILYNKILKVYKKILNSIDLPLSVESECNIENITKLVKVGINVKDELLDNLFLLIDLEKVLSTKNLLVFINLKQYLTTSELVELYKYAIYNEINIMLIDSQCYGCTLKYEKKFIIDENLDEFVL